MAYTGCSYSCPMTISKLKEIETKIKEKNITNYQIVIASFDSIHDTPEKLKTYMETKKLDTTHWSMLSADKDSKVRELSVLLGISYKKEGQNDFAHSNIITLLDKEGVILVQLNGMNADNTNLLKQIQP
jgi:protein SCO1/2